MFHANVGERFLYIFMNQSSPIYGPDSRHCSEHGIRHGNVESFRLLRTKDGQNELYHSPLSRVPAIFGIEAVFWIMLRSELPYIKIIFAASRTLAL